MPSGVDAFAPPAPNRLNGGAFITEGGTIASLGDTVTLAGDSFTSATRFRVFAQSAASTVDTNVAPRRFAPNSAVVTLPANPGGSALTSSLYFVYPGVTGDWGRPFAINRTEARWLGPDRIEAGGATAAYGVNLSKNHGTTTSFVYMKPVGSFAGQFLTPTAVNPYRVAFQVPANATAGSYEIWVHNGHGGRFGWSGPLTLTVQAQSPWAGTAAQTFNVRDFGAVGDGVTADDQAIGLALNAAEAAAPATVFFPAGTYLITRPRDIDSGPGLAYRDWQLPNRVRWLGAGAGQTIIRASSNYIANASAVGVSAIALFLQENGACATGAAEMQDLTVDAFTAFQQSNGLGHPIAQIRRCTNLRFTNVTFNGDLDFSGADHLFFNNVTFQGNVFANGTRQVFFTNSTSLGRADADSLAFNGQELSIIGHTARDLDPTADPSDPSNPSRRNSGIGSGRLLLAQGGHTRNYYIGDSQTIALAPSAFRFDGNSGEQILFEHPGTMFAGFNGAFNGVNVILPGLNFNRGETVDGSVIIITSGKGFGQRRTIVSSNQASSSVTIDRPFTITPDSSSYAVVQIAADRLVVYNNSFQGKPDYASRFSASSGVQPNSNTSDLVVDNNRFSQLRSAYLELTTTGTSSDVVGPQYFNYFINNQITNGLSGLVVSTGVFATAAQNANIVADFGLHIRDNQFSGLAAVAYDVVGAGQTLDFIAERNQWTNVFSGFITNSDGLYGGLFLLNNTFTRGTVARATAVNGDVPNTSTGARVFTNSTVDPSGTTFSGFTTGNTLTCTPTTSACPP